MGHAPGTLADTLLAWAFVVVFLVGGFTIVYFTLRHGVESVIIGLLYPEVFFPGSPPRRDSVHKTACLDAPVVVSEAPGLLIVCVAHFWTDAQIIDYTARFLSRDASQKWKIVARGVASTDVLQLRVPCDEDAERRHVTLSAC